MLAGVAVEGAATIVFPAFQLGSVIVAPAKSVKITPFAPGRVFSKGTSFRVVVVDTVPVEVTVPPAISLPAQSSEVKRRSTSNTSLPSCTIW